MKRTHRHLFIGGRPQTVVLVFRDETGAAPLTEWLETEPKAYAKCLERILQLERSGYELRRPASDMLRDGIRELRAKQGRVQYRILYFFCGKNIACLSHGFTKEGKVPDAEIERAIKRRKLVVSNGNRFTMEWEA